MSEKHFIKNLASSWLAVIIGTGGLGNILYQWQSSFMSVHLLGTFLAGFADILYFIVLIPWMIRWVLHFEYVKQELHHPVTVNFFVAMLVATIILGVNIYTIWSFHIDLTLVYIVTFSTWVIAVIGVTFFTFHTTFRMMSMKVSSLPENMNLSWFMAPIANMTALLIGNPVLEITINLHPSWALSILIVNIVLLGIGFTLFNFISGITFVRLAQKSLSPVEMTSFFGISLGAVGLSVCAIIDTAENAQIMGLFSSADFFYLLAGLFWGFGLWIVGFIIILCIHQLKENRIPFSLGWWAFIFSLHAYTIACQKIAAYLISPLTTGYTIFLTVILIALWLYTFGNTVHGVVCAKLLNWRSFSDQI